MSSLARCAISGGPAVRDELRERSRDRGVVEEITGRVGHGVGGRDGQAPQRAGAGHALPVGVERVRRVRAGDGAEQGRERLRGADPLDRDVEGGGLDVDVVVGRAECVEQARVEGAELQLLEELAHRVLVPATDLQRVDLDVDRHVATQDRHLAVVEHLVAELAEVLTLLGREVVEVLEDAFEGVVGAHELRRGLLADARDAGQVVARVAAQRRVLRVLDRA